MQDRSGMHVGIRRGAASLLALRPDLVYIRHWVLKLLRRRVEGGRGRDGRLQARTLRPPAHRLGSLEHGAVLAFRAARCSEITRLAAIQFVHLHVLHAAAGAQAPRLVGRAASDLVERYVSSLQRFLSKAMLHTAQMVAVVHTTAHAIRAGLAGLGVQEGC